MPKNPTFRGKMVEVDIYESGKHFMKGQPVSDAKVYTPSISKPLARGEVSGLTEVGKSAFLSAQLVKGSYGSSVISNHVSVILYSSLFIYA